MEMALLETRKSCPCCAFDLFLPPDLVEESSKSKNYNDADNEVPLVPQRALEVLLENTADSNEALPLVIVDSHGHAQLERETLATYRLGGALDKDIATRVKLKAIICAVEPADWNDTLEMAAKSSSYLPALGIHPWYLGGGLPDGWLLTMEKMLVQHPSAIVGEIGLCKMARWTRQYPQGKAAAFELQRQVFKQQLQLAARLCRPVSVHCVDQHGVFVGVLKDILGQNNNINPRRSLPPAIAMHSFTGSAHHVKELLSLEKQLKVDNSISDPLFYFGFSHTVNYVMNKSDKSRRKAREAVCSVPPDRLLVESDVHSPQDLLGGTAGAIAYVAWARTESLHQVARGTSQNGMAFLASVKALS